MAIITITTPSGEQYNLTFTRREVSYLSDQGLTADAIERNPLKVVDLFAGAFLHNHKGTPRGVIEELWKNIDNKPAFAERLGAMYGEPIGELFGEADEAKKVTWEETK